MRESEISRGDGKVVSGTNTASRGIPKFQKDSVQEFLFHLILLLEFPEISKEIYLHFKHNFKIKLIY